VTSLAENMKKGRHPVDLPGADHVARQGAHRSRALCIQGREPDLLQLFQPAQPLHQAIQESNVQLPVVARSVQLFRIDAEALHQALGRDASRFERLKQEVDALGSALLQPYPALQLRPWYAANQRGGSSAGWLRSAPPW
jgi:hypothetical protein